MNKLFTRMATQASEISGSSWAFLTAAFLIILWLLSGPVFHFSDTWQLVMNTISSIVTFLMVFLIQNAQNRDTKALHLKMDEIIHVIGPARNELIKAEDLTDEELTKLRDVYRELARRPGDELDKNEMLAGALHSITEGRQP